MNLLQVSLRGDQEAELQRLTRKTGQSPGDFVRHGIDLAIAEARKTASEPKVAEPTADKDDWKKAWLDAAGIWADRDDLDELHADMRRGDRMDRLEKQWRGE